MHRPCGLTAESGCPPQQPFGDRADREPHEHVARPMSQQDDSCGNEPRADRPNKIAGGFGQLGRRRSQRADMQGVTGRKRIQALSGKRHATLVPANREAVGPSLIEDRLQEMRQRRGDHRRDQNVIGGFPQALPLASGVKPPRCGKCHQNVLISAPGQGLRRLLRRNIRMGRDRVCDPDVDCRWTNGESSHRIFLEGEQPNAEFRAQMLRPFPAISYRLAMRSRVPAGKGTSAQ
jgi:hypothetical protein